MKRYKVVDYKSGKVIMIGTAKDCASLLDYKSTQAFQRFAEKCEYGVCNGKNKGHVVYADDFDEDMAIHEENLKILDSFYSKYRRSPTVNEFKQCGGDYLMAMRKCHSWCDYLEDCGYDKAQQHKTVNVFKHGDWIDTGTVKEMAEKYYFSPSYVRTLIALKKTTKDGLSFKYKPFTGLGESCNG